VVATIFPCRRAAVPCEGCPGSLRTKGTAQFSNADLIHRYTRADALREGVLIDVSPVAREAGIRHPVALTRAVWQRCVAVPPGVLCQDEAGRLWDVLWSAIRWPETAS
jgi:hypothetical protein